MYNDFKNYSDRIVALEETVARLSSENQQLKDKTDDLESRSRRCNLRIVASPRREPCSWASNVGSPKKVKFSLRFPARLFLEHAGERLPFDSHEDAQPWFDRHFDPWPFRLPISVLVACLPSVLSVLDNFGSFSGYKLNLQKRSHHQFATLAMGSSCRAMGHNYYTPYTTSSSTTKTSSSDTALPCLCCAFNRH
ncbi:hypothetical protein DPEC_G00126120 [Dallia pectoralis]|uniref:Uncharacterized protein n=1 Tax=Dallia pectoralis TaxID=75939 RepID=A0ACC2GRG1_DALPE|nr:hypothetical protein DPEC_G00126120 [Dallia pectoralis]